MFEAKESRFYAIPFFVEKSVHRHNLCYMMLVGNKKDREHVGGS